MTAASMPFVRRVVLSLAVALMLAPLAARADFDLDTTARNAILLDATTGQVLYEKAADERIAPASISKLMTVYVLFEKLSNGSLKLTDTFPVSVGVWKKWRKLDGSTMFLNAGQRVTVENLIQGIIVQSGDDACDTVAEGLAGSQDAYAKGLNDKAAQLGLKDSHFVDASGWPDPEQYMTVRDMAHLAQLIIDRFPQYYHYFAEKAFTFNGVHQENRNMLLGQVPGVDGLKTGHVDASGYSMVASEKRGDLRLIAVISGTNSTVARAREGEKLLSWGFTNYQAYTLAKQGQQMDTANVWLGEQNTVPLVAAKTVTVLAKRSDRAKMVAKVIYKDPVPAPIAKGQPIAVLQITGIQDKPIEVPLLAGQAVDQLGGFARIKMALSQWMWGPPPAK